MTIDDITGSAFFSKHQLTFKSSTPKLKPKKSLSEETRMNLIKKVSLILNVEEEEVKWAIENRDLGEIFCVYQILLSKEEAS